MRSVEAEYLRQVSPKLVHRVAYAARAELAEVREVFAYLRGVHVELVGERLRRDGLNARDREQVQTAKVDAQTAGRQLRNFLRLHRLPFLWEDADEYNASGAAPERHAPPPNPLNVNPRGFIISLMSEGNTQNLPDTRSFEERVFARFDALDARMARMESRLDNVEARLDDLNARVERLEAESERRAVETKPIWERALAEIVALGQKVDDLGRKVDALDKKVDSIERRLKVLANDMLTLRGDQERLEDRMDKLDSEHAR